MCAAVEKEPGAEGWLRQGVGMPWASRSDSAGFLKWLHTTFFLIKKKV